MNLAQARQWERTQRCDYKFGRLSAAQIEKLERIPDWTWDKRAATWEEKFGWIKEQLQLTHKQKARVSAWKHVQRVRYAAGTLLAYRAAKLETLPGWSWALSGWKFESRNWTDRKKLVKRLARENGGKLPTAAALAKMGHKRLGTQYRRNRKKFKGVQQESAGEYAFRKGCKKYSRLIAKHADSAGKLSHGFTVKYSSATGFIRPHRRRLGLSFTTKYEAALMKNKAAAKIVRDKNNGYLPATTKVSSTLSLFITRHRNAFSLKEFPRTWGLPKKAA